MDKENVAWGDEMGMMDNGRRKEDVDNEERSRKKREDCVI